MISGDLQSLDVKDFDDPIKCAKAEAEILSILGYAETICPNVYFIPGNHDPPDFFSNFDIRKPALITKSFDENIDAMHTKENCYNVHGRIIDIAKGLKLVGYGGSKNNLVVKDGEVIEDIWEAYPYENEEDYSVGLKSLFSTLSHQYSQKEDFQVIVMTHIGPYNSPSSIAKEYLDDDQWIYCGSKTLEKCISDYKEFVLMNIHGHNHESEKSYDVDGIQIVNPNSLFLKNYAEIYLKKEEKWKVDDVKFMTI
jgi:Icc-related predicted phosphoesterase